jgi:PAS domain S-box-containing protein
LKEYNERLINKLEKKMLDLESEITERKQAEENIKHLNAVLRSIRGVNQLIIREKDREILLQKACDVLIEARGYEASCLGFLSDEKTFASVAGSGFGEYISRFSEHVMDGDHPPCIKNALAQKGHLMIVDKSKVCGDCFFKNTCVGRKAAIIRVEHANRLFGLLVILFAPDVTPDEEEKGLLKEVAGDIALSLHNMELEEEHKRAEEALRESEKKYRRIFENIQDVYYESSLDGTILETSPSIEKVSKYNRKELIGRSLYDIYTNPEERDEFVKIILDKGKVNDFEISLTDKDGSQHLCSITTLLVKDEQGNPIKFIGSMHDISERKQAEEEKKKLQAQLQQAQKMEAIGTLAGGIAHDFNNILTLIMGYTELTMMNLPEDSPFRDNMNKLFEAGERARDLVKQILTFSRQREEEQKPVQIHLIVKEALKLLRPTLPTTIHGNG